MKTKECKVKAVKAVKDTYILKDTSKARATHVITKEQLKALQDGKTLAIDTLYTEAFIMG